MHVNTSKDAADPANRWGEEEWFWEMPEVRATFEVLDSAGRAVLLSDEDADVRSLAMRYQARCRTMAEERGAALR
jgi:hypothetical protein